MASMSLFLFITYESYVLSKISLSLWNCFYGSIVYKIRVLYLSSADVTKDLIDSIGLFYFTLKKR